MNIILTASLYYLWGERSKMSLKPIVLSDLLKEHNVSIYSDGIKFTANLNWVVDGEDRLSYTTLTRLVECCREYHWNKDVETINKSADLDSITKSVSANYFHPVYLNVPILISYQVIEVRSKGYCVKFIIANEDGSIIYAEYSLILIFFSNLSNKAIAPSKEIIEHLRCLSDQKE